MTGVLQSDGTYCRKGLNCKRHGNAMRAFFDTSETKKTQDRSVSLFAKSSVVRKGLTEKPLPIMGSLREKGAEWREKLTDEEKREINVYRMINYIDVNAYLYGKEGFSSETSEETVERFIKPSIELIDSALSKASTTEPKTLYRTFKVPDSVKYLENLSAGDVIDFPSYTSTTVDSDIINDRTKSKKYKNVVVFEMITRKGAYIPHDKDKFNKDSVQYREQEVLLPRGLKFRVVNTYKKVAFESSVTYGYTYTIPEPEKKTFAVVQLEEVE